MRVSGLPDIARADSLSIMLRTANAPRLSCCLFAVQFRCRSAARIPIITNMNTLIPASSSRQTQNTADQLPNKTVIVRDKAWSMETLHHCLLTYPRLPDPLGARVKPNLTLLRPDGSVFLETNAHGFIGPEVDTSRKLVALWGDSTVAGWGEGWIAGLDEHFPGYQFLNGGINTATINTIVLRAMEVNRCLPITYNVIFAGWNTMRYAVPPPLRAVSFRLNRLLDASPNTILCTQPTSLNATIIQNDLTPFLVPSGALRFRAGYSFWPQMPPTSEYAQALYNSIMQQNALLRDIVAERRRRLKQEVPIFDFYRHFDTEGAEDFRDNFIDAGHVRVEAYPLMRRVFCEEFAALINAPPAA